MQPARIAELLQLFLGSSIDDQLSVTDLESISTYIDILMRWNTRINLTAIRDPEEVVTRHFGESLFAARHLFPNRRRVKKAAQGCPEGSRRDCLAERGSAVGEASGGSSVSKSDEDLVKLEASGRAVLQGRVGGGEEIGASALMPNVADLGSGAGFPGIPLKLWAPGISLTLIESNQKKATFLREVARALSLWDINIRIVRAQAISDQTFDLVTFRAVERFEAVVPIAIRLLAPGGRLALLIGSAQIAQAQVLGPALSWAAPIPIPESTSRVLLVAEDRRAG